jgi:hypothetical protein
MPKQEGSPSREESGTEISTTQEREGLERVQGFVAGVNNLFNKKYGLSVPETDLPLVIKGSGPAYGEGYTNLIGEERNVIKVKDVNQISEGSALGEEMSHFYRSHFRQDHKEIITDEFFGWMGRRLLFKVTQKKDGTSDFFPDGEPAIDSSVKRQVIERTKATKNELRNITKKFTEGDLSIKEVTEERKPLIESRKRDTHHFRGYEFASKVDLSRIKNWQKLYSMPDEEVRKRFFTPNPDYSGLEQEDLTGGNQPDQQAEMQQRANDLKEMEQDSANKNQKELDEAREAINAAWPDKETDPGKVWNILSRHYFEWGKSINPEDLKTIKEYQRWSLPVNSFLRGAKTPERATEQDLANINTIVETLDRTMNNCPPTPVEFMAYRAVPSDITLEDAEKMIGKPTTLDKGYMSTSTSRKLTVNDFLQKKEGKILYEITVPKGEKGIWVPSVTSFSEIAGREGEFLLPRDSQFVVTGAEEQQFINRRSRNAEDSSAYGKERQSPSQFVEKRLVIKLTLQNKNRVPEEIPVKQEEKTLETKQPKKSWLSRIFGR